MIAATASTPEHDSADQERDRAFNQYHLDRYGYTFDEWMAASFSDAPCKKREFAAPSKTSQNQARKGVAANTKGPTSLGPSIPLPNPSIPLSNPSAFIPSVGPSSKPHRNLDKQDQIKYPEFPSTQTIHNSYREMVGIWRDAYRHLNDLRSPDPVAIDNVEEFQAENFDAGASALFSELKRHLKEITQRNNALKQLIHEHVPISSEEGHPLRNADVTAIVSWLEQADTMGFIDTYGDLRVSRRTPVNTVMMEKEVIQEIRHLVGIVTVANKAVAAS